MSLLYKITDTLLPFSWLSYDFMKNALFAVLLIAPLLAILGTMAVNNKMAYFSDALGHSALTGIALGVIFGLKNELLSLIAFGIIMALLITKVKSGKTASADTVIGVFSSTSIAIGLLILSVGGGFPKYSQVLIGDILSITGQELLLLFIALIFVIIIWGLLYNRLLLLSINKDLAESRGIHTTLIENAFVVIVAVVVMLSIKWVGILLINSLLILPAAASRNIAKNSRQYLLISVIFSLFSGVLGLTISFYFDTSAGAAIVLVSALIFFATYLFRKNRA